MTGKILNRREMKPLNWYRFAFDHFRQRLEQLKPMMAQAAQKEYDAWEQDEEGMSEWLGAGGLCQEIAQAICDVLSSNGVNCATIHAETGEQHVWSVAWENEEKTEDGYNAYHIDIAPSWYETGGGYVWKKIPDVVFSADMVGIGKAEDEVVEYLLES